MSDLKKPDYVISVLAKGTKEKGIVGVGWVNDDGSISIKINPGCLLNYNPSHVIRLFPNSSPNAPIESKKTEKEGLDTSVPF